MSKKIQEATTKSTRERLLRHTRMPNMDPKYKHMKGRTQPKKTGNNDPHRGGNPRLHNQHLQVSEDLNESVRFLYSLIKLPVNKLEEAVQNFQYKETLYRLVNHLIACGMGGWRKEEGVFVNESDQTACLKNWTLTEDGFLAPNGRKRAQYDIDGLLEIRGLLEPV